MRINVLPIAAAMLALAASAQAQPAAYTWTGMGTNVPGSAKCPTYRMTIDVAVDGTRVEGRFQQQGRPERHFEATADANGSFKTKAMLDGGNTMIVTGSLKEGSSNIVLDGYCRFGGRLVKK